MTDASLERGWIEQRELQAALHGDRYPADFGDEEKIQYIKDQTLAVISELNEALAEVGWKPWASSNHITRDAFVGELRDAWQHLMNLMQAVGVTPEELAALLYQKHLVNWRRVREGYDGVSTKCPHCHRALDDKYVTCTLEKCNALRDYTS